MRQSSVSKKRQIYITVTEEEYERFVAESSRMDLTISNCVRLMLKLPTLKTLPRDNKYRNRGASEQKQNNEWAGYLDGDDNFKK